MSISSRRMDFSVLWMLTRSLMHRPTCSTSLSGSDSELFGTFRFWVILSQISSYLRLHYEFSRTSEFENPSLLLSVRKDPPIERERMHCNTSYSLLERSVSLELSISFSSFTPLYSLRTFSWIPFSSSYCLASWRFSCSVDTLSYW